MGNSSKFDAIVDRTKANSQKWTYPHPYLPSYVEKAPLPMWVADMDFASPQPIIEALEKAVRSGIFGYFRVSDSAIEAIVNWQKNRHGFLVDPSWMLQSGGVVAAIAMIVDTFSKPGDSILIQSPVYGPFHSVPMQHGRRVIPASLTDGGNSYQFNPKVFEDAICPDTKIFVLSNPHNPTGHVWTKEELTTIAEICLRHNILMVADDIHQDLVWRKGVQYTALASLAPEIADKTITCTAPSKTFNIAGLQTSNVFVSNPIIRKDLSRALERFDAAKPNLLGQVACEAAYSHCEAWLEELLEYLRGNWAYLEERIATMSGVTLYRADSLYLAWLDFREAGFTGKTLHKHLLTKAGVWLDDGMKFGEQGSGFARINFGCPRVTLKKGLDLIEESLR